ncbi:hypothetical protein CWI38_2161p0010, partial [Hamiltosporidium tvaerminnensis]
VTYNDYLIPFVSDNPPTTFPSLNEFVSIINQLLNWKAAGIDDIHNFFIKKLTTLHKYLYDIVKVICLEGTPQADWSHCEHVCYDMKASNLYINHWMERLEVSKAFLEFYSPLSVSVLFIFRQKVCERKIVSGTPITWRRYDVSLDYVLSAKEQALLNIAPNKEYGNNLNATWINVKEDYDSIDYAYLTQCIENLNIPDWFLKFIKPEKLMQKNIKKGVLQEDSLSRLLFVLSDEKYTKGTVQTDSESQSTNQILFFDDLKLLAKDSSTLSAMTGEAKEFLKVIGLEINKAKSATKDTCCVSVFKYLGIIEDNRGIPTLQILCQPVLRLKPAEFSELDDLVRAEFLRSEYKLVAAIHKVENNNKNHLALSKGFLKVKYMLVEEITKKSFEDAQLAKLYNEIEKRKLHSKLYNVRKNELVSLMFCYIQYGDCGMFGKTVYHLATRCKKMLGYDYTRRYNGVFRDLRNNFFDRRRGLGNRHPLLRAAENEEDDVKEFKTKNIPPYFKSRNHIRVTNIKYKRRFGVGRRNNYGKIGRRKYMKMIKKSYNTEFINKMEKGELKN